MARSTPLVRFDNLLYQQNGQEYSVMVGTQDWFAWLNTVSTFSFSNEYGTFTARKEPPGNRRGGEYWKAYRTYRGKLHRAYLGKSETLTLERLNAVAAALTKETEITSIYPTRLAQASDSVNARPFNLPAHLQPLVGRGQDVTAVCTLLKQTPAAGLKCCVP